LCDIFWENLDWEMIQAQLKGELRVLEVGCGTGRYGEKLKSFANIESYLGIDIEPNNHWAAISSDKFHFQIGSYEDVLNLVRGQNLIITQSAIEHFEQDIVFFDSIKKYAESCDFPVIAIHLFPSPACLFTMLLHGIRQYNRRAINQLVKVSGQTYAPTLFTLGGFRSNYFHFAELTLRSLVLRRPLATKDVKRYLNKASKVLFQDSNSKLKFSPAFYALCLTWKVDATELMWVRNSKSSP
jgi:SAM-dependent methyltransferase